MIVYADVILPLPLQGTFAYIVPVDLQAVVKVGSRVVVPFGSRKYYTGIVKSTSTICPGNYSIKELCYVLDDGDPVVKRPQVQFWEWVAEYYLSGVGDVMKAALPSGLKIESETFIELSPEYHEDPDYILNEREALVIQALDHCVKRTRVSEIEKLTGLKNINSTVGNLLSKGAVIVSENLVERYTARKERYVRFSIEAGDRDGLAKIFASVRNAKSQERAVLALVELSGFNHPGGALDEVTTAALRERAKVGQPILKILADKGFFDLYTKEINRFKFSGLSTGVLPLLSEAQAVALRAIHSSWVDKDVTLLHGVTSSGKTELYMHLADFVMKQGRQVLYLVPEIALTTQLTTRIQRVFGDRVVVYHSKFSDNERVDLWRSLLAMKKPCIVIGARSSLFLPFENLGLIIVDEEHDSSYKQTEPAPRYNARDAAMMLARMHGAKTLLGSATPAIDTYYKAITGRFGLVNLDERYGDAALPEIEIVDTSRLRLKNEMQGSLAKQSVELVNNTLERGDQAIIFINRRGYAPVAVCGCCGYTPRCECCDVTLTYHKSQDALVCHYCGARYPLQIVCPVCHEPAVSVEGYGTERVEEEIVQAFPGVSVARMDLDTTRKKEGYSTLIDDFSNGRARLLVGTQMVTKGLDFGNVGAVIVVNADSLVNVPDFRSSERAFNTISQVAGRAGRRGGDSKAVVMVQARSANHPLFEFIKNHDYQAFYDYELGQRLAYAYPPFTRLIHIYIKHRDAKMVDDIVTAYKRRLESLFGNRVIGPETPSVSKIQNLYIRRLMLKIEVSSSMKKVRGILRGVYEDFHNSRLSGFRGAIVFYDVDPC